MSDLEISPGAYLVASPMLMDPNFRRTVVMICEHGDAGSLGLVLNRPTSVTISEVVPDMAHVEEAAKRAAVYSGGPVESNRLMVLRLGEADLPDAALPLEALQEICAGVSLVADISGALHRIRSAGAGVAPYRFFLGYAGWGRGQLRDEMKEGAWLVRPPDARLLFESEPKRAWHSAMLQLGGVYRLYAQMPHDPTVN